MLEVMVGGGVPGGRWGRYIDTTNNNNNVICCKLGLVWCDSYDIQVPGGRTRCDGLIGDGSRVIWEDLGSKMKVQRSTTMINELINI